MVCAMEENFDEHARGTEACGPALVKRHDRLDLDADTLDVLLEMLDSYEGTVLLVSHDRDFLDRVVTQTLAFEGDGKVVTYAGGYSDVETQRALAAKEAKKAQQAKVTRTTEAPAAKGQKGKVKDFVLLVEKGRIME